MAGKEKRPLVLGIGLSPRKNGNSDFLLKWALTGARQSGARVKKIFSRDLKVNYCLGCRYCETKGECIQKDDFQKLYQELESADFLIIATPIFFLGIPGHSKAMIDRFQTYWSRKYLLGKPPLRENRKALVLLTAGSDLENIFDGAKKTLRAFFQVSGFDCWKEIGITSVDEKSAVQNLPSLAPKIKKIAQQLVQKKTKERKKAKR